MVQKEVRRGEEETRQAKAVTMGKQGSWTRWEGVQERTLTWQDIWNMEGYRVKFLLSSVYDVLPTPSNLHIWGLAESPGCTLCGKPANLEHVLSSCRSNLADGKFRWRHDQVLTKLAEGLEQARRKQRKLFKGPQYIKFLRAGETSVPQTTAKGILSTADDWEMRADLQRQLKFPEEIATTTCRPDVVLWSKATKQVALVELTVPWEERMEEAHEFKRKKYQALILDCQQNGWKAWNLPVEVGCRGFAGRALWRTLGQLGIEGLARKQLISSMTKQAEVASRWIWLNRDKRWEKGTSRTQSRVSGGIE